VVVLLGPVEGERVLEARAAATANGDPQGLALGVALAPQQLADLLDGLGLRVIASVGVSVTSQSVARGLRESRALSPSAQTAVVCDTTAYLPDALVAEREIQRISLYVSIDDRQEAEAEITDFADFYERLRASEGGATTSQPSIGDFAAVYEPLLEAGREIVSIHISAGISGTFEAAVQARDRLTEEGKGGERIRSSTRARRPAGWASASSPPPPPRRPGATARRSSPGRTGARGAEDVVRDRHPRVPAARRPDRRGTGLDRLRR
jgi:hypothetical protein